MSTFGQFYQTYLDYYLANFSIKILDKYIKL